MSTNTITVNELSKITSGYATDLLLATRGTTGHKMNFGDFAKYVTETYQAAVAGQNQSIIDALNEVHTAIGGPQVAATAAAMTDQTKIYVYTGSETGYTAGNWYYYNGSAWTSGGVYNAVAVQTDPSLSEEGVAADAKATGDAIDAATVAIDDTLTQTGEAADAKKTGDEISELKNALTLIDTATDNDIGKALSPKTVTNGRVTEWQFEPISGGGGGTSDYGDLENKPQINSVTLAGNKSLADLGIASASKFNSLSIKENLLNSDIPGTTQTIVFDGNGNPASIIHTANNTTVRTDTFVWGAGTVMETRTLSDKYVTLTTDLTTLETTISEILEVA